MKSGFLGVPLSCPLCDTPDGTPLWQDAFCRVILADEPDYPGFLRVIVKDHIKEMTNLPTAGQAALMRVVFAAEAALREVMQPDKINIASLGNVVPHLHWHVIARFDWDSHFPAPVWAAPVRPVNDGKIRQVAERCQQVNRLIAQHLSS